MPDLPGGTVTFLFTDIEGSTRLWEQHPEPMRLALARHDARLHRAITSHAGLVFKTVGDQFCAAFATAPSAVSAALTAQQELGGEPWGAVGPLRVRMALHTGAAEQRDGDYFGPTLNRVARLLAAGHGDQILLSTSAAEAVGAALPADASFRDLGSHRLKDLQQPEQIFQLLHPTLPAEFPPLRSLETFAHNLPAQLTSFIGREEAMAQVKQFLASTRLLTLTGSGGCGKTRLALQVAADLLETYGDGVWLVELAPLGDPALVPQTVAAALGLREQPGRPLTATLTDYLRPKTLLLILDNCEHLLAACAQLADVLLRSCSRLQILASSREGLGIAGEQTYRVPSLSLPDSTHLPSLEKLQEFEAVQLFAERARLSQPTFVVTGTNASAVVQVCRRLDGIPLAVELAAARVKALPVEQINQRLDDRFRLLTGGSRTALPRQQTLRALIDWSYDLLSEGERALLRRLSVFAGGWTLPAAEAVCTGGGVAEWEVLDLLTSLVDKSLVVVEEQGPEARYRFLETVRQYARDRLLDSGEADWVRGQHLDFFFETAQKSEWHHGVPVEDLRRMDAEHGNLRAALEWCKTAPNSAETGLRLINNVWWGWYLRSHIREGREYLTYFLSREEVAGDTVERAKALNGAGFLANTQGDLAEARSLLEQSLEIARRLGLEDVIGAVFNNLGDAASNAGDDASARTFYEESLAFRRKRGNKWGVAWALIHLGRLARLAGEYERAASLDQESLSLFRELGNLGGIPWALLELGKLSRAQEDGTAAHSFYQEALKIQRDNGSENTELSRYLEAVAALAVAQGQGDRAARLYGVAETLRTVKGTPLPLCDLDEYNGDVAVVRAALGEEAFAAAWAEGQTMSLDEAVAFALQEPTDA
jgi:predicted ATPase/class 3 adenylate cyclase